MYELGDYYREQARLDDLERPNKDFSGLADLKRASRADKMERFVIRILGMMTSRDLIQRKFMK
jgi:hypothetical protein